MTPGAVIILSGPPGAGKSTVAEQLVQIAERSVLLTADAFWHFLPRGCMPPWQEAAHAQNGTVLTAVGRAVSSFAADDYLVVLDGVLGPWFLATLRAAIGPIGSLHYVVLRPALAITLARATARQGADALTEQGPVRHMHAQFAALGS